MLTISISEALQGPAAWSEWGSAGAEVGSAEWQQQVSAEWGLEALDAERDLASIDARLCDLSDPAIWNPWSADANLQRAWDQQIVSEAAASLALASAMQGCSIDAHVLSKEGAGLSKEAAWASPLRVPLPAPLAVEPLSEIELPGLELELLELPAEGVSAEPQKLSLPPSLRGHSGSGLGAEVGPSAAATATALSQKPAATKAALPSMPQGMAISEGEVAGRACQRVDWKIDDFSGKLQASMGRPVVSPAFSACGLSNLRLMVFPDARDAVKRARGFERKALYANMVKQGPLYGSLKLKADGLERNTVMTFSLLVGGVRAGPTTYDFSEQAVLGLDDFDIDWLQQVDKASGAINVGIEIIEVRQK